MLVFIVVCPPNTNRIVAPPGFAGCGSVVLFPSLLFVMDAQETSGKEGQTADHNQTSIGSEGNGAVIIGVENTTGGDVTAEQSSDERWTKSLGETPGAEMLKSVGSFGAPEVEDSPGWRKTHSRSHSAFAGEKCVCCMYV